MFVYGPEIFLDLKTLDVKTKLSLTHTTALCKAVISKRIPPEKT